jgi:peptide chain release factor 1
MFSRLDQLAKRLEEVEALALDTRAMQDQKGYRELMKERSHLLEIAEARKKLERVKAEAEDARSMAKTEADPEMRELAKAEAEALEAQAARLDESLKMLLIPRDPLDEKGIIMEIRAGTGGEEAALFAADLYRMYVRYAERKGWKIEVMDMSETGIGGFKEIVFSISGKDVFSHLRYESGVHRVQRVPATEASGRIHTSAVTVAVLPEMEETEIELRPEDLRIDVCRASGPGGQCVNTTDSAVRITHIPTGIVVQCQDEKSQIKNKAKAMRVLRSRIYEREEERRLSERAADRKSQIGSGDRSERIRTYNFPQNRLTDHRINLTLYKLELAMLGEIDEVIEALRLSAKEELLKANQL